MSGRVSTHLARIESLVSEGSIKLAERKLRAYFETGKLTYREAHDGLSLEARARIAAHQAGQTMGGL